MRITIESTDKIVEGQIEGAWVPFRVWKGRTESGIEIHALITRIAVADDQPPEVYQEFERELQETRRASPAIQAIPARLIL